MELLGQSALRAFMLQLVLDRPGGSELFDQLFALRWAKADLPWVYGIRNLRHARCFARGNRRRSRGPGDGDDQARAVQVVPEFGGGAGDVGAPHQAVFGGKERMGEEIGEVEQKDEKRGGSLRLAGRSSARGRLGGEPARSSRAGGGLVR